MIKSDYLKEIILRLCEKVLTDKIAIDDNAREIFNRILESNSLEVIRRYENGADYLIDIIRYYEDFELSEITEDLIDYILKLNI